MTRPEADSARIARDLAPLGVECMVWPLTRIVRLVERLDIPAGTEALLFTSPNGVRAFTEASPLRDLPVLAVGDRTAAVAREAGFADVASAGGDAADLARLIGASGHRRFLHPRGREAGDLAAGPGVVIEAPAVYAAEPAGPPPPEVARAFAAAALDIVTVWSPRHARLLRDWLDAARPPLGGTDLLGISRNAVEPLGAAGFRRVVIAARPDAGAMIEGISAALRR